jgi:ring-1,2-phenylacetyl-CoA epoxidase subunit PaaE
LPSRRRRPRRLQLPARPVPHPARHGQQRRCTPHLLDQQPAQPPGKAGELEIGIRPVEGGVFSNWAAQSIKAGDTLSVMPPDGRFVVKKQRAIHRVGFAAGSGITPILSIAASTLEEQPESKFTLVYGNRRMSSVMFNEALQDLKDRYPTA